MEYSEWNKQFENKMSLYEWIAHDNESTIEWAIGFVKETLENKPIHIGDCTRHPCSCSLCHLEAILGEYRKYYFEGTFRDKDANVI